MRSRFHVVPGALLLVSVGRLCGWCQEPPPPQGAPPAPTQAASLPGAPPVPPLASATPSAAPQPFSSSGTIHGWNYGPNGDTNGFTLDRNVLVMFPPEFGAALAGMARLGSRVSVTGVARSGVNVLTVVNAQSLTANGQTVNVGAAAGAPPPPRAAPALVRGRRGPPPPPAVPGAPPPPPQL